MNEFLAAGQWATSAGGYMHAYRAVDGELPRALCSGLKLKANGEQRFDVTSARSCRSCVAIIGQGGIQ